MLTTFWKVITRKKLLIDENLEESRLSRVLNTFDLTALGVGSTLGVGVYVLAGHVAKETAGPAVVLSFLIAAVASLFAGLCYAEFGARVPKAGSAYIYSYVCVGELIAFIIGWNLILEYIIGSASVSKGLSSYLDSLLNNSMSDEFHRIAPINIGYMSSYFDFFAFGVTIILSIALAFGMKESSIANNIFTLLNVSVVLFVIIAGSTKANFHNWNLKPNTTNDNVGNGGFFPFGIEGVIKGAATCFYGFVGFDCIATTGEEVKNPQKAIPLSILLSLLIIFLSYFGTSMVITLMVPYFLEDSDAPIPHAFQVVGWEWARWIVAVGAIFGLCASLFGAMFPLPRILYAMASDGLVFRFLGRINDRFKSPVLGTLIAGLLTGLMAAIFDLKQLVNMMSIGTLLAYTIVAASVLLLRYSDDHSIRDVSVDQSTEELNKNCLTSSNVFLQFFNSNKIRRPTKLSQMIVAVNIFTYCVLCVLIGLCAIYLRDDLSKGRVWAILVTSSVIFLTLFVITSIASQPQAENNLTFKVPCIPLIPALSIIFNIYLMLMLDPATWVRFGVWMAIGFLLYGFYAFPNSINHYIEYERLD